LGGSPGRFSRAYLQATTGAHAAAGTRLACYFTVVA
jgi:hypothetical protein